MIKDENCYILELNYDVWFKLFRIIETSSKKMNYGSNNFNTRNLSSLLLTCKTINENYWYFVRNLAILDSNQKNINSLSKKF